MWQSSLQVNSNNILFATTHLHVPAVITTIKQTVYTYQHCSVSGHMMNIVPKQRNLRHSP